MSCPSCGSDHQEILLIDPNAVNEDVPRRDSVSHKHAGKYTNEVLRA